MTDRPYRFRSVPLAWLAPPDGLLRALLEDRESVRSLVPPLPRGPDEIRRGTPDERAPADDRTVSAILKSLTRLGAPPAARENARALGRPGTLVVVTGQQPGLLGGPLYAFLKAAGTVRAAEVLDRAERDAGSSRRWVPVFWNASEDHDLDEVNTVVVPDAQGRPRRLRADIVADGRACRDVPAGGPEIDALLDEVESILPVGPHREFTRRLLRETRSGSIASWFSGIMLRLLGGRGLVVVEPEHVREATRPLMEREIREPGRLTRAVARGSEAVRAAGLRPVLAGDRDVNLFVFHEGLRRALVLEPDGFRVEGTAVRLSAAEILADIADDPSRFSTNVALRPLVQDAALPVGVQLAGPTELAYLAELTPAHEDAGVFRPFVLPRPAATLLETSVDRALRRLRVSPAAVLTDPEHVAEGIPTDDEEDALRERFARLRQIVLPGVDEMVEKAGPSGAASRRRAGRLARHLRQNLEKLERTVVEVRRTERGVGRGRVETILDALRPLGRPQERVHGILPYLDRHGPELVPRLLATIDPFAFDHRIIAIP